MCLHLQKILQLNHKKGPVPYCYSGLNLIWGHWPTNTLDQVFSFLKINLAL